MSSHGQGDRLQLQVGHRWIPFPVRVDDRSGRCVRLDGACSLRKPVVGGTVRAEVRHDQPAPTRMGMRPDLWTGQTGEVWAVGTDRGCDEILVDTGDGQRRPFTELSMKHWLKAHQPTQYLRDRWLNTMLERLQRGSTLGRGSDGREGRAPGCVPPSSTRCRSSSWTMGWRV